MGSLDVQDISGRVHYWHATSEKHMGTFLENDNEINAVDHHPGGLKFATSGSDFKVQVRDLPPLMDNLLSHMT